MELVAGWLEAWARRSNVRATANARAAATACSQRLVERAEVEAYLVSARARREPAGVTGATAATSIAVDPAPAVAGVH